MSALAERLESGPSSSGLLALRTDLAHRSQDLGVFTGHRWKIPGFPWFLRGFHREHMFFFFFPMVFTAFFGLNTWFLPWFYRENMGFPGFLS